MTSLLKGFYEWSHPEDQEMDVASRVSPKQFSKSLRHEMESFLETVMEAVNEAPDGEWIAGSEEQVRNLAAEFRERVFQKAVQQRIDAAEAAFPPSAGNEAQREIRCAVVTHLLSMTSQMEVSRAPFAWHRAEKGSLGWPGLERRSEPTAEPIRSLR